MALVLIRGFYEVTGDPASGDTIRFYAEDPTVFKAQRIAARLTPKGGTTLRLGGIDALMPFYNPPGTHRVWHQPAGPTTRSAQALLDYLGFSNVERSANQIVTATTPERVPGYVFTRYADSLGRPVVLGFAGEAPEIPGGRTKTLDIEHFENSANYHLVESGWAYPAMYSQMYLEMRQRIADAAREARFALRGMWAEDVTTSGTRITSRQELMDDIVLMPKLFRRLADFLSGDPGDEVDLTFFRSFLKTFQDRAVVLPDGQFCGLENLVEVTPETLRLTVEPERIVYQHR